MSSAGRVRLRDRAVYVVARVAIGVAARVPQWLGYRAAALLGRIWFRLDRRRQAYADRFLQQAFPELDAARRRRLGSDATASLFMIPLDMARLTRLLDRGGDLSAFVDVEAASRQVAKVSPPYFGLAAHLGSWEVGAASLAALSGSAHGIARVTKNPLLNRWLLGARQRGGLTIHPRRGGFRDLARAMEAGSVGLQVVDQNQRLRGVFAPFFGKIASCERAAVSLALRRRYPILVGTALRKGYAFRFELVLDDPFVPERTGDKQADLLRAVTEVNARLERLIRRAPEQYVWIHDRYRTQPSAARADGATA